MKTVFYKIKCLTNLHVGSGEVNYNIIDNEVEKDAVTGLPMIHASGVKGALRDALAATYAEDVINKIFGKANTKEQTDNGGTHKFLDACLLARPMRLWGTKTASIPVVTEDSVNRFVDLLDAFGANEIGAERMKRTVGKNEFLTNADKGAKVENETTQITEFSDDLKWLKALIGEKFAFVGSYEDYPLPVTARNCLDGKKGNLWYEEVVPHGSVLYFAVIYPDGAEELEFPPVVQFGGNASIGCGYTKIERI